MSKELIIKDDGISITDVKDKLDMNDEHVIRVYKATPTLFQFQFRALTGINEFGEGRKRKMVAGTMLTLNTMRKILAYMEREAKK